MAKHQRILPNYTAQLVREACDATIASANRPRSCFSLVDARVFGTGHARP